jgi:hypothetical protein
MNKGRRVKPMFSLSPVEFRDSPISGRGVFARRSFGAGETVVAFAPKQRRVDVRAPEAAVAAQDKVTLLSDERFVIIPDRSVPGGWLCNHSCEPNAAIHSSGEGRVQATRSIAAGHEVTVFYGWVTHNEPGRDACRCGAARCRGTINFDLGDEDAKVVRIDGAGHVHVGEPLRSRLAEYGAFLHSIGQEQVQEAIANTLVRMKLRGPGRPVCAF